MAWIRTSMSLIAFGFTIYKFFEYLATSERRREPILSPWVVGMVMIVVGLTGLALAWIQNRQQMKALEAEAGPMPYSIAGIIAFLGGLTPSPSPSGCSPLHCTRPRQCFRYGAAHTSSAR